MLAEFAQFVLMLALLLSVLQVATVGSLKLPTLTASLALASFFLVLVSFVALVMLRVDSDFTVLNVAEHSNVALPLLYKIAGTWGNHEGSMLLWLLVLTGFAAMLAAGRYATTPLVTKTLVIQSLLVCGTLGFILLTSNPFARIFPPPTDGAMLNPLLQDIALAIHPPLLYGGYVGFSLVFSFAVAGLWQREVGREWAAMIHPWIMLSWSSLTLGIGLGSWWAYRELGWGGFWFWDPVENASLLPWLSGTALLHANLVLKKRGALAGWVLLLAILTFGLSLIGTFLVRSGLLTSVHSFASDPERGLYILVYMAVTVGSALWLYASRIGSLTQAMPLRPASREGMIVINNLFLLTACATVLIGTLYPLVTEGFLNRSVTVGAPYFHLTFLPLMAIPLFFAGLTPFMPWKKAATGDTLRRAWPAFAVAAVCFLLLWTMMDPRSLLAASGVSLAVYLLAASGKWLLQQQWKKLEHWSVFFAHGGVACVVLGITGVGVWSQQVERMVNIGDHIPLSGYVVHYFGEEEIETQNYRANRAHIDLYKNKEPVASLVPEYRTYKIRNTHTSEAAIYSTLAYDVYAVIGETDKDAKKTALRLYFKPTVSFLWLGGLLMSLGGVCAIINCRRYRND